MKLTPSLVLAALGAFLATPIHAAEGWRSVPLGGGGFVSGILSSADAKDLYIRTDVGGVFRWDATIQGWQNITDLIVSPDSDKPANMLQTAAMAVDPADPRKLYVAVGSPHGSKAGGIFASTDKGLNWARINGDDPAILVDGNGGARGYGERLAVDPNNPRRLWFGSTQGGLYTGEQKPTGEWIWQQIPATGLPFGKPKVGVNFVLCDNVGGRTTVYAGVSDEPDRTGGVYSTINGIQWNKLRGANPNAPARAALSANGTLFVTAQDGVYKMTRGGNLQSITPLAGKSYRAVAVSPDANIVYVAEANRGTSSMWRSSDGGKTWAMQSAVGFNNRNIADGRGAIPDAEPDGTPALTGYWHGNVAALWLNPRNPADLWATDYFGVSRTLNADKMGDEGAGEQPVWHRLQVNQEETVVFNVVNAPSGPQLMTGVADVGGFAYKDITTRPVGPGGRFANPGGGDVNSIDFSEGDHTRWARTWSGHYGNGSGAYSADNGATWLIFGQIAKTSFESGDAGWETWDLSAYIASRQTKGAATVTLILASENTSPVIKGSPAEFDSKESADELRPQLVAGGKILTPVADAFVSGSDRDATANYGDRATLQLAHAYTLSVSNDRHIYLKFDLTGLPPVTDATLRLHRKAADPGLRYRAGVFACADTGWAETTLNWKNRPLPYACGNPARNPLAEPRYKTAAGASLAAGRIAVSSIHPDTLVWMPIGTGNQAHYSTDRGVTWNVSTGGPRSEITGVYTGGGSLGVEGKCLASDRVNGRFYLADFGGGGHIVYRSDDGKAWTKVSAVPNGNSHNMRTPQIVGAPPSAALPGGGDVWLCDDGSYNRNGGGLWRSVDGAESWTKIEGVGKVGAVSFGKGAKDGSYTVFIHGLIGGKRGIYQSDDCGATWREVAPLATVAQITALAGDRQIYGRVFIGTGGRGVFVYQP